MLVDQLEAVLRAAVALQEARPVAEAPRVVEVRQVVAVHRVVALRPEAGQPDAGQRRVDVPAAGLAARQPQSTMPAWPWKVSIRRR